MNIMKRTTATNDIIKFNATNVSGMKEIMVKAHALARLTRVHGESYAHAFKCALKLVWRKIRRADTNKQRLYIYRTGNSVYRYDFVSTTMSYIKAVDYMAMLEQCEVRKQAIERDIENDNFTGEYNGKQEMTIMLIDYLESYYPQLIALQRFDNNTGYDGFRIFRTEIQRYVSEWYIPLTRDMKTYLKKFVDNYVFGVKCRLNVFIKTYGLENETI